MPSRRAHVVVEKHGERYVHFIDAMPSLRGEGASPAESLSALKDKIRFEIREGRLKEAGWKEFLEWVPSSFEDIVIEGLGNLRDFKGKTIPEIQALVRNENLRFISSVTSTPEGWPEEIVRLEDLSGETDATQFWSMNLAGDRWQHFYAYGIQEFRKKGLEPAYIYERKNVGETSTYTPIVSLLFSEEEGCTRAGTAGCRMLIENAIERDKEPPPFDVEVNKVFRCAEGLAQQGGAKEVTLDILECAIDFKGLEEKTSMRFRFGDDVQAVLRTAFGLKSELGKSQVDLELLVKAIRQFKEGSSPAGPRADA